MLGTISTHEIKVLTPRTLHPYQRRPPRYPIQVLIEEINFY